MLDDDLAPMRGILSAAVLGAAVWVVVVLGLLAVFGLVAGCSS